MLQWVFNWSSDSSVQYRFNPCQTVKPTDVQEAASTVEISPDLFQPWWEKSSAEAVDSLVTGPAFWRTGPKTVGHHMHEKVNKNQNCSC